MDALALARRDRRLGDKWHPIHGIGKNQAMPVHGGWHRQLIDQLEIDAIGLGRGVAPLAIELTDAAPNNGLPQHRDRCRGDLKHHRGGIAGPLKRRLSNEPLPGTAS